MDILRIGFKPIWRCPEGNPKNLILVVPAISRPPFKLPSTDRVIGVIAGMFAKRLMC